MTAPPSPFSKPLALDLRAPATRQRHADGRAEIRCAGCGYGAVLRELPERCPMCGSTSWRAPFKGRVDQSEDAKAALAFAHEEALQLTETRFSLNNRGHGDPAKCFTAAPFLSTRPRAIRSKLGS
jgi:hypothetical protein